MDKYYLIKFCTNDGSGDYTEHEFIYLAPSVQVALTLVLYDNPELNHWIDEVRYIKIQLAKDI